jgi:hypothetical protein
MHFSFGRPSCGRALRCVGVPNLRTCGRPCVADVPCVCIADVRWGAQLVDVPCVALGRPTCGRVLCCVWAPILRTCLALRWGSLVWTFSLPICFAFGRPSCGRALRCVGVPNLQTCGRTLRLRCGRALGRPTSGRALRLRWGTQLADVPFVCALRTCVGVPNLRTCLALRWVAQLANVPCVAFGRPSCGRASRFVGAPNLGEVVLKSLPPSKNLILSLLHLVF